MRKIIYNSEDRTFAVKSSSNNPKLSYPKSDILKGILVTVGAQVGLQVIPKIIKVIIKRYGNKTKDDLLYRKNERANNLFDKYSIEGKSAETDPKSVQAYKKEIHSLLQDTLQLMKYDDRYDEDQTIYKQVIAPFIGILRMILIKDVHILAGTNLGADRRPFELVYDPNHSNPDDVARDPFRTVIFNHKWPSHGFEVKSLGAKEANELISDTVDFLANNPKFLAIRV